MTIVAIILVIAAFIGGWWYTVYTLRDMEDSLFPHLLGFPIGFVAMFCLACIFFFFGIFSI